MKASDLPVTPAVGQYWADYETLKLLKILDVESDFVRFDTYEVVSLPISDWKSLSYLWHVRDITQDMFSGGSPKPGSLWVDQESSHVFFISPDQSNAVDLCVTVLSDNPNIGGPAVPYPGRC